MTITWAGSITERQNYYELYQRVEACVGMTADPPFLELTAERLVYNGGEVDGITWFDPYYIMIYEDSILNSYGIILAHEYVHYILRQGNELHGSSVMTTCGQMKLASRP